MKTANRRGLTEITRLLSDVFLPNTSHSIAAGVFYKKFFGSTPITARVRPQTANKVQSQQKDGAASRKQSVNLQANGSADRHEPNRRNVERLKSYRLV